MRFLTKNNVKNYTKYFKIYCIQIAHNGIGPLGDLNTEIQSFIRSQISRTGTAPASNDMLFNYARNLKFKLHELQTGVPINADVEIDIAEDFTFDPIARTAGFDSRTPASDPVAHPLVQVRIKEMTLGDIVNSIEAKSLALKEHVFKYGCTFESEAWYHNREGGLREVSFFAWIDFDMYQAYRDLDLSEVAIADMAIDKNVVFSKLKSPTQRLIAISDGSRSLTSNAFFYADGTPYNRSDSTAPPYFAGQWKADVRDPETDRLRTLPLTLRAVN